MESARSTLPILLLGCALLASCARPTVPLRAPQPVPAKPLGDAAARSSAPEAEKPQSERLDFSRFHPSFRFSAEIPAGFRVAFVPAIQSINIYDPSHPAGSIREQSQIFIRTFEARSFLTLSTVTIHKREETTVGRHGAVRYEIEKKSSVPSFPHQPSWRSSRHSLTDVRFTAQSPSLFYVFAMHPSLPAGTFDAFLGSLRFHNDPESFVEPLPDALQRITKKPFGIVVSPGNSPVDPERFAGYHTGADMEILAGEEGTEMPVFALCGGKILLATQAEGYGGVAVQECLLGDEPVTVVYGHLALSRITAAGTFLAPGDAIGVLGTGGSPDTDGERKHLHLGVRKGTDTQLAGYVRDRSTLAASWIDPATLLREP